MWVFTKYGFFSVTCARQDGNRPGAALDPSTLQVRARAQAHLENLVGRFPPLAMCQIVETPSRDYRFRMFVPREMWIEISITLMDEIMYSNFKAECSRQMGDQTYGYSAALHDVWGVMHQLQHRVHGRDAYVPRRLTSTDMDSASLDPAAPAEPRKRKTKKTARKSAARKPPKPSAVHPEAVEIEETTAPIEMVPTVGHPQALFVCDADNDGVLIGVVFELHRYATHAAAYASAVKRGRIKLVAHPQFTLVSDTPRLRAQLRRDDVAVG